ncbi:hypothetical protein N431DRAFT_477780 [Stipitochalara longipes BDJ]|nr:hypothetical protein N431DRAFT_477780 [Stipitochalara longipes BDJ]
MSSRYQLVERKPVPRSSVDPNPPPAKPRNHLVASSSSPAESESLEQQLPPATSSLLQDKEPERQRTGLTVPFWIVGGYLLAIIVAICHYIFFHSLDGRPVDSTIKQEYISAISIALVTVFRAALKVSLATTFAQLIWNTFRKCFIKLSTIDNLFGILNDPLSLFSWDAMHTMPLGILLALLFWAIPIATIFPPGALTVIPLDFRVVSSLPVPSYNSSDTRSALFEEEFFFNDAVDPTVANIFNNGSSLSLAKLAEEVILQQSIIGIPSPCGSNCSYTTQVTGPVFNCSSYNSSEAGFFKLYVSLARSAITEYPNDPVPIYLANSSSASSSTFQLDLQVIYSADPVVLLNYATVVTCSAYEGVYTISTNFSANIETTTILSTSVTTPLNPSQLNLLTVPLTENLTTVWNQTSLSTYSQMNSLAIATALSNTLTGNVTYNGNFNGPPATPNGGTLILSSALRNSSTLDIPISLIIPDPQIVAAMLQNLTISVITLGQWNTSTAVSQLETKICYSFSKRWQLVAPYATCLALSLVFAMLGFRALGQNGVPARSGAMQILAAFAGSDAVRSCTLGWDKVDVPTEMEGLEVRLGVLRGGGRVGFGTEEELRNDEGSERMGKEGRERMERESSMETRELERAPESTALDQGLSEVRRLASESGE